MSQTHIEEGWERIARNVFTPDMPPRQREEMRVLFFLGAMHMHDIMLEVLSLKSDQGRDRLNEVVDELKIFGLEHYTGGHA